jgi:hypothetical protein
MKLNSSDLREAFQADIKDKIPETRKFCPSPKKMLHLFRGKISENKKAKIVDHITNCYYCSQEFEFIIETLRYEKNLNNIAKEFIAKKGKNPASKYSISQSFSSRFKWGYSTLIVSCILVFSLTAIFIFSKKVESSKYRGTSLDQIELIKPRKKMLTKSTLAFEWEAVQEADYYVFEIFDETLYPIWTSEKIILNSIILPRKTSFRLESNKSYYWMVTAFLQSGIKKESMLKEFQIKE